MALAKEVTPAANADEAEVESEEMITKATAYYTLTLPLVAGWLAKMQRSGLSLYRW